MTPPGSLRMAVVGSPDSPTTSALIDALRVRSTEPAIDVRSASLDPRQSVIDGLVVVLGSEEPDAEAALLGTTDGLLRSLAAAARAGARRAVVVSTLALVDPVDRTLAVTEDYCSRPTPEPELLMAHLGEVTAREAARDGIIDVTILRIGVLGRSEGPLPGITAGELAVAVTNAMRSGRCRFAVVHVHGELDSRRFPLSDEARGLLRASSGVGS